MLEQTTQGQNSDSSNLFNRLVEAIAGNASHQRPQPSSAILKPTTTNTLIFEGKTDISELFRDLSQTMLKMLPETSEAIKVNHSHSHPAKETLQTVRNIIARKKRALERVFLIFRRKYVRPESQATAKHKWHKLAFDSNTKTSSDFLGELNELDGRMSFWASWTTDDWQFFVGRITPTSRTIIKPSLLRKWHLRSNSCILEYFLQTFRQNPQTLLGPVTLSIDRQPNFAKWDETLRTLRCLDVLFQTSKTLIKFVILFVFPNDEPPNKWHLSFWIPKKVCNLFFLSRS